MFQEFILKLKVNLISLKDLLKLLESWTRKKKSKYICLGNVHMCMEAYDNPYYKDIVNESDLTLADGKYIYWALKILGRKNANHIRGYDLTLKVCELASHQNISVGFFGSTSATLKKLKKELLLSFPNLKISFLMAPPFGDYKKLSSPEYIKKINSSSVKILFIGLGCPKQEIWMSKNKKKLGCTLIGVGAAIDFISKNKKNPPRIIQSIGAEWLFRLVCEPQRLLVRNFKHNPRFLILFLKQMLNKKFKK